MKNSNLCRIIIIFLFSVLLTTGCGKKDQGSESPEKALTEITLSRVAALELERLVESSALIESRRSVMLSFLQGGYLAEAPFEMGDFVKKDDTLAILDLRALEADYIRAKSALEKAERDFQRAEKRHRENALPEANYDDLKTALQIAEAGFKAAQFALDRGIITAPFSGQITERYIEPDQTAPPGAPVYGLVDIEHLELKTGVAESEISFIRIGDLVEIILISNPSASVKGKVTALPASGQMTSGLLPVTIRFTNPGNWLPGMAARAMICAGLKERALAIPAEAVRVSADGEAFCYRYRDETQDVLKTPVQVENPSEGYLVVLSGVSEGDMVVCGGADKVRDGDKVKVAEGEKD